VARIRATKHALEGIAATLRDELAPTGITVQTINPAGWAVVDNGLSHVSFRR
jgi:NAD(P)-dependent dehydrogenase (short-subunit alcohol dehydrogenase family)